MFLRNFVAAIGVIAVAVCASSARADGIDIALSVVTPDPITVGETIRVDLILTASGDQPQAFDALGAVITWDPEKLLLLDNDQSNDDSAGPYNAGFFMDADGINEVIEPDTPTDGDAYFQAFTFGQTFDAPPSPGGFIATSFLFQALMTTPSTEIALVPTMGNFGASRVLLFGEDITRTIHGPVNITIVATGACCVGLTQLSTANGLLGLAGQSAGCIEVTEAECMTRGGAWLGEGTVCDPDPCAPTGACCLPQLSLEEGATGRGCMEATESECISLGGIYEGDDIICTPSTCLRPTGACCFDDGSCQVASLATCEQKLSGSYLGDGTSCEPNPCLQPTGACCFDDGSCQVVEQVICEKELGGSYQGDDTSCDACPQPGACCVDDLKGQYCLEVLEAQCASFGGIFQGAGSVCPDACLAACCFDDGSCTEQLEGPCADAGGTFQGLGTACVPNLCPQPTGACCFDDGSCQVVEQVICEKSLGGSYQGDDTSCAPNACPQPGACCVDDLEGQHCLEVLEAQCASFGGMFQGPGSACPDACLGACCFTDGSCAEQLEGPCADAGGTFQGLDATCVPNLCPQPTGACCFDDGSCQVVEQTICEKELSGSYQGDDTSCAPNACPQPGACCVDDLKGQHCLEVLEAQCTSFGGIFRGAGSTCPGACLGACCFDDGSCAEQLEGPCADAGGTFQGLDTACVLVTCPQPTGACCFDDGSCQVVEQVICEKSLGGSYQGDDTSCAPDACPQPTTGACCFGKGQCAVDVTQSFCEKELGGVYQGDGATCAPDPCASGACCVTDVPKASGVGCINATEAECLALGGVFQGPFTSCKGDPCAEDCNANGIPDPMETAPEFDPLAAMAADECLDAEHVCTDIFYNGNTFAATHDTNLFCGLIYGGLYDVWYSYRPATDGTAVVKVCNYNFDFVVNGNPNGPEQYGFGLTGTQEVPPVHSTGSGTACVTLNTATNELSWNVTYQGLTGPVMAAHFHGPAPAGVNAGVQVNITASLNDDGTGTGTAVGSAILTPAQVTQVQAELWYLNFHTAMFPGGEIRGQVRHGPCMSGNLPVIAVFEECPETDDVVEPLACNFASAVGTNCGVIFEAQGGETYYIRIAGEGNTRGWFELEVKGPPCLLNPDDINNNGIPDECECLGDVDGDGDVDGNDIDMVIAALGMMCPWGCPEDVNADGIVDNNDLEHVVAMLGPCPQFEESAVE